MGRTLRVLILGAWLSAAALPAYGYQGETRRVSVSSSGAQGNGFSYYYPAISDDGRYVAYESESTNLVPGDTNGHNDIFVFDRLTGQTERVSVSSLGAQANWYSYRPDISGDGRFVAFGSVATNLVPNDTNQEEDVYLHDRLLHTTTRVSVSTSGQQGNLGSYEPVISSDGRTLAFWSYSTNLVSGDTWANEDVFVRDLVLDTTTRVSVSATGQPADGTSYPNSISSDGRYVAFHSNARNLHWLTGFSSWGVFVHDRQSGYIDFVAVTPSGLAGRGLSTLSSLSHDGRFISFTYSHGDLTGGTNYGPYNIFARDLQGGVTSVISQSYTGSPSNSNSDYSDISGNNRFVAYESAASNLVPNDTNATSDAFVYDRALGQTHRVSVSSAGLQGDRGSNAPVISADGRFIAFSSESDNLVFGDSNGWRDIFVHQLGPNGVIEGTVFLPDFVATSAGQMITVEICSPDGATNFETLSDVPLNFRGHYSAEVNVTSGSYVVFLKGSHWLRKRIDNVQFQPNAIVSAVLTNGDVDGDNEVGPGDFGVLSSAFGSVDGDPNWEPNADLDGDGEVGPSDFGILSTNFGLSGD